VADDPARPAAPGDSRHTRTTASADLPTGAAGIVATQPPGMPTAAGLPSTLPPGMPTAATPIVPTTLPPGMPTAPQAIVPTTLPPGMPTAPQAIVPTTLPPGMPTAAAPIVPTTLPPGMPTAAAAVIASGPPPMPDEPPALPGALPPSIPPARYELQAEIARGGMGRVVEATDHVLGRVVAFKEALSTDRDTLRRFLRETRITARLEHPSIVPVHDAGESRNGAPFYVMRKVSGRPLERLVAQAETLGQRLALIPHIVDSAQAIAHAHERGIVHRDIKPSNILVGDLGETVVIDWGLAKVIGEADEPLVHKPLVDLSDSLKTRAGIVYGTPGFMAPEQLRGAPVNEQADVYALGATLYHLLSRTPPHHAKTADEMMKAAVAAAPTPIRALVDGVPPDLATIVDKALAHDPAQRYQDARALAMDLQRFLTGQLVASHHYSPREKVVRFVKQNRGLSAAVAALLVIGSFAILRIIIERNRADHAAAVAVEERAKAEAERETAIQRTEELTLSQARSDVETNPTKAIAMLKPLAAKRWRDVRAIAAAARASGVAWSAPTSKETLSLELSHDGRRALSAGGDGVVRIHDLVKRTTRPIADLRAPVQARFADDERQVVTWHDRTIAILDPRTGARREVTTAQPIDGLEVVGITAYFVDHGHALWQLDLAGTAPTELAMPEPISLIAPSPDGRWLALGAENHLLFHDRTQPTNPPIEVSFGATKAISWSADARNAAVLIDQYIIDVELDPDPSIIHRQTVGNRDFVAHGGGRMLTIGPTGVAIMSRTERGLDGSLRKQVLGKPVGLVEARGDTMVAGGSSGLTVMSPDGDRILPLTSARVERVLGSPRSPYIVAQLEGRLLVWNLDDFQPQRLTAQPTGRALLASSSLVIAGGSTETPALAIDLPAGKARPLGTWPGLRAATASRTGHVALIDGQRKGHVLAAGRDPEDLPGDLDFLGFATDDVLVYASLDGAITAYDVGKRTATPVDAPKAKLLGLAWGRGRHPWIAGAFADGTLWRKNLVTHETAKVARVPALDPTRPPLTPDGRLVVEPDGTVLFLHGAELHAWGADGQLARLATAPKPIDELGEAGTTAVVLFTGDGMIYAVPTRPPHLLDTQIPPIDARAAVMSPDTGMLAILEHGAIEIHDPVVHQRWRLAEPAGVTFANLALSPDGKRVLAHTEKGLLVWTIELPESAAATVAWLDAMTNAVDDRSPGGIGWR
jgi:WD40 repeat protein